MKTTLNEIREHEPCAESWEKFLKHKGKTEADNEPIEFKEILEVMGLEDAVWCLRALDGKDKEIRLFACDCAESVLHLYEDKYPNDSRVRDCVEAARKYAVGDIDLELLEEASDAAWDAACDAAWDAACDAARAARAAAWDAARDAARAAARAARDAARDAARAARAAAWDAARDAAGDAEQEKQKELFIKYFC